MEEEYFWEERRRFQEEMDYFEWQRMQGRPGMPPPPPFGHAGGVRLSFTFELQCKKTFLWPAKRASLKINYLIISQLKHVVGTRAATIQLPHDTIGITIFASHYDTYRDTFLTTLEP